MAVGEWEMYLALNKALCEVVFSAENAETPVYLDMDEDVLAAVARRAGVPAVRAAEHLSSATRGTLGLDGHAPVFGGHIGRLRAWQEGLRLARARHQEPEPPPVIALLGVFTLAAEAMAADSDHAAHAYYPRLFELLRVDDRSAQDKLTTAYRQHAESFWRALSDWLSAADGRYGLPTSYALSHRYVGLPMSQALVRSTDRRRFPRMFSQFGLPPGVELPPADMVPLLDAWIRQNPCPTSKGLQSLWLRGAGQERIATVAAIELQHWDGAHAEFEGNGWQAAGAVQLVGLLRRFPRPQLELSFVADFRTEASPRRLSVLSAAGSPTLDLLPATGLRVRPRAFGEVDPGSLVEGLLHLQDPDSGKEVRRHPRRVVPLRRDDLINAYSECERVQLGEDVMLLVKDQDALRRDVMQMLAVVARPGFREHNIFPGLPAGWVLITDVQVMATLSAEPARSDLNALVPLVSSQLTLAGGLKLPGRARKWSSLRPPEVRAVVQDAKSIAVTMTPLGGSDGGGQAQTWTSTQPSLVVDLATESLPDGDYELALVRGGRVAQQTLLRLRSSETPDLFSWETAPSLVHDLSRPLTVLAAEPANEWARAEVNGPFVSKAEEPEGWLPGAPATVWWTEAKPSDGARIRPIVVAAPDPTSCVVTGAHRIELPTFYGKATSPLVTGTCSTCGLVKRFPAWYSIRRSRRKPRLQAHAPPKVDVQVLPGVKSEATAWDDALDALVHTGGGRFGWLERLALQIEGSSLFVDTFARAVEALGHVEVSRGSMLEPEQWRVTPPYLVELVGGSLLLTGAWTPAMRQKLCRRSEMLGGRLTRRRVGDGPSSWIVSGVDAAAVGDAAEEVGAAGVVPDAAPRLARALPSLCEVEQSLPRVPMPGSRRATRFHPPSASWVSTGVTASPGAYRLESAFATTDVFRTGEDVAQGNAAIGTVQLVKHLEARRTGRPLIAYDHHAAQLAVPLGADLPGLYGRAAVLCSGRLPTRDVQHRKLIYHNVPADVAALLARALAS
ncbi:hypothetical protein ABN034_12430 [Actinopolymorpha sp. B11F2]|uniref:hypothetical protein n=1 Tax=Actinopolymorpha sp. B11F2 TaxID=3160862 RepID=UPI0032E40278